MFRSSRDEQFQGVERPCEATCPIAAAGTAARAARAGLGLAAGPGVRANGRRNVGKETLF